jgi:mycothiol synthase
MSDHWDHVDYSEEDYLFWLQGDEEFQPDLWKVAWDTETNQVAGMVLGFINQTQNAKFNRKRGWPEDICVRRQWRKRGVAHALIAETLREFKSRGMDEAAMYADTENLSGAFQLYRDMGFSPHKTRIVYQKQIDNQRSQD